MSVFKFKQFEVDQAGCAMKINTDGVLIAAIASHCSPKNILDIGTGTGVIALMLAQRYAQANIEAVEIDQQAAETAGKNFSASVFKNRLSIKNISIEDYYTDQKFDLIVSNPPFFVNDLKNEEVRKGIARHANANFFELLIDKSNQLLNEGGEIWLILPVKQANEVIGLATKYDMAAIKRVNIHSDESKPTFRQIICLSKTKREISESDLYIYASQDNHTSDYKALLKDFFLAF